MHLLSREREAVQRKWKMGGAIYGTIIEEIQIQQTEIKAYSGVIVTLSKFRPESVARLE